MNNEYSIAQFNWAQAKYDPSDERMSGFMDAVDGVNLLAKKSPGFLWKYEAIDDHHKEQGHPLGSDVLLNCSIWENVESLKKYTYQTGHLYYLQKKRDWFVPLKQANILWKVPKGSQVTLKDCIEKMKKYQEEGSSEDVFDFQSCDRFL